MHFLLKNDRISGVDPPPISPVQCCVTERGQNWSTPPIRDPFLSILKFDIQDFMKKGKVALLYSGLQLPIKLVAVLQYIPGRDFQSQGDWNDSIAGTHVRERLQKGVGMWNIQLNVGK